MTKTIKFPKVFYAALAAGSFLTTSACQVSAEVDVPIFSSGKETQSLEEVPISAYLQAVVADVRGDDDMAAMAYSASADAAPVSVSMRALEKYLLLGDFDSALKMAKHVESLEADTMMHWLVLMVDAIKRNDTSDIKKYLEKTQQHLPDLVQLRLIDAYMQVRAGKSIDEALKVTKGADIHKGYMARLAYHTGRMALIKGNKDKALEALEDSQKVEEGALFTTRLLARVYAEKGQIDKAYEVYDVFREKHKGALLLADVSDADFLQSERQRPLGGLNVDAAESFFGLSVLLWAQGAETPARQFMALAIYLAPEEEFMPYYMGVLTESIGRMDVAQPYYEMIKETPGLKLAAASRLSASFHEEGKFDQAERILNQSLEKAPGNPILLAQLAQVYEDQERYREAIKLYDEMAALDPSKDDQARIYFARGAAWERLREYNRATEDLEASLKIVPDQPMVLNYLGYMWVDADMHVEEGLDMLKRAHKLAPQSAAVLDSLGWAYFKVKKYAQAQLFIEKAVNLDDMDGVLHYHLGDVYEALGNHMMARKHWNRAYELGVDTPKEHKELKRKLGL